MSFKYQVLDALHHDGRRYEPGELVELEEDQAANLARIGVLSATPAEMAEPGGDRKKAKGKAAEAAPGTDGQAAGTGEATE